MKNNCFVKKRILLLIPLIVLLSGCGFSLTNLVFNKSSSFYYNIKISSLVKGLAEQITDSNISPPINKIAVMDLVDYEGRIPVLGKYLSLKIMNEIAKEKYFKLVQRGELENALNKLEIKSHENLDVMASNRLGENLAIQAIVTGKIIDIGTNLEVYVKFVSVSTGEIIASTTNGFNRTDTAVQMLNRRL